MNKILEKIKSVAKSVADFFFKKDKAVKTTLKKLDYADIFMALSPVGIFGCLLFGLKAVLVLVLCVAVCLATDFVWNLIFKKQKKGFDGAVALTGFLLGLSISSLVNIFLVIAVSVLVAVLLNTVFKNKPLYIIFPVIIIRVLVSFILFRFFESYPYPFLGVSADTVPIDYLFGGSALEYPAKYLFFGLHSGNIGDTSDFLLIIGGVYLALRRVINPVIGGCYVATVGVMSLILGNSLSVSLLGGGVFFAAIYMTMDYGFKTTALYKKIAFGVCCGLLTMAVRLIFKTEGVFCAVLVTNVIFIYFTHRNIIRTVNFVKKPDFKKLLKKVKSMVTV